MHAASALCNDPTCHPPVPGPAISAFWAENPPASTLSATLILWSANDARSAKPQYALATERRLTLLVSYRHVL